jgi:hypothetical protein
MADHYPPMDSDVSSSSEGDEDNAANLSADNSSSSEGDEHVDLQVYAPDMFEMAGGGAAAAAEDIHGQAQSVAVFPPPKGSVVCRNLILRLRLENKQCGIICYLCPYCEVQFPIREFDKKDFKHHLVRHIHYVVYHCTAVSLWSKSASRAVDHERHPSLAGTTITDAILDRYKLAAYNLRTDLAEISPNIFPYVDVTWVDKDRHVYFCAYCCFNSKSLVNYKHHVVTAHVILEFPLLPDLQAPSAAKGYPPGAEHPGLVVMGPPHVL